MLGPTNDFLSDNNVKEENPASDDHLDIATEVHSPNAPFTISNQSVRVQPPPSSSTNQTCDISVNVVDVDDKRKCDHCDLVNKKLRLDNERVCDQETRLREEVRLLSQERNDLLYKLSLTTRGTQMLSDTIVSLEKRVALLSSFPAQKKGCDCGAFVCVFADFLSRQAVLNFCKEHMNYFPFVIAWQILNQRFLADL